MVSLFAFGLRVSPTPDSRASIAQATVPSGGAKLQAARVTRYRDRRVSLSDFQQAAIAIGPHGIGHAHRSDHVLDENAVGAVTALKRCRVVLVRKAERQIDRLLVGAQDFTRIAFKDGRCGSTTGQGKGGE